MIKYIISLLYKNKYSLRWYFCDKRELWVGLPYKGEKGLLNHGCYTIKQSYKEKGLYVHIMLCFYKTQTGKIKEYLNYVEKEKSQFEEAKRYAFECFKQYCSIWSVND